MGRPARRGDCVGPPPPPTRICRGCCLGDTLPSSESDSMPWEGFSGRALPPPGKFGILLPEALWSPPRSLRGPLIVVLFASTQRTQRFAQLGTRARHQMCKNPSWATLWGDWCPEGANLSREQSVIFFVDKVELSKKLVT